MRIYKSDGRYKYHSQGYEYIAQFGWASLADKKMWSELIKVFEETYGPHIERYTDENGWPKSRRNEHYVLEQNKPARRRRIYAKHESDFTIALLKVS